MAKWQPSREPGDLARSVAKWLQNLALVSPELSVWFIPRGSPSTANQRPFQAAPDRILAEAQAGPVLPRNEDAFIFRLWNGKGDDSSAALGVRDRVKLPGETESRGTAELQFPRTATLEEIIAATRATVEALEPQVAGVASSAEWSRLIDGYVVGPVMYFADTSFDLSPLPVDVSEEPTRAPGRILRLRGWSPEVADDEERPLDTSGLEGIVHRRE